MHATSVVDDSGTASGTAGPMQQHRLTRFAEDMGTDTSAPLCDETCGAGRHHQQHTVTIPYLVDDRRRDVVAVDDTQGGTDTVRLHPPAPRVVDRGARLRDNSQHLDG